MLKDGTKFESSYPTNLQDDEFTKLLDENNVEVKAVGPRTSLGSVLLSLLPLLVFIALFVYLGRSARRQLAGMGGIGRARSRVFDAERPETTFGDVAGYEGVKREVAEVVDFLKHPDRYRRAGAVGPKGVLMVGPQGRARPCWPGRWPGRPMCRSSRSPAPRLSSCSWGGRGQGPGSVRRGPQAGPSIVFIDEIDAIGQRRGASSSPTTSGIRP